VNLDPATDLSLTRYLKAPRSVLWECWTTPEHIKNFFVPRPHKIVSCEIDLRVGGKFNTVMDVDGQQMDNKGVYLEIVDQEKLVFTDAYSENWKPAPDPFMTAIVTFEDHEDGTTKYTAIARHRSTESKKTHEDMGFHDGWGTVVQQLEEYAQSL
jgi:uncharacterized protein YndB with AHSA1/START domain